jgi:hypothetical protein
MRDLIKAKRTTAVTIAPDPAQGRRFPRLQPFPRCRCGECRDCRENDRWDRVFARFEVKQYWEHRGLLQSPLRGL